MTRSGAIPPAQDAPTSTTWPATGLRKIFIFFRSDRKRRSWYWYRLCSDRATAREEPAASSPDVGPFQAPFHVCARAAVYSSLFGSGPPRSCIGKQTAHGAPLGPRAGGVWTRIQVVVAASVGGGGGEKKMEIFLSIFFLSPVAVQVVDVGARRRAQVKICPMRWEKKSRFFF